MATSLLEIKFQTERQTRPTTLDNDDFLIWANEANADIGMNFDLPASTTIALTATDMEYALPTDLKIINRLRLQSVVDEGFDREFGIDYRIYNGSIIFPRTLWIAPDSMIVDYYKHMEVFTSIDDEIELEDRYSPLYMHYALMKYYDMPETATLIGEQSALRKMQAAEGRYRNMKIQLTAYQQLSNQPVTIRGRW